MYNINSLNIYFLKYLVIYRSFFLIYPQLLQQVEQINNNNGLFHLDATYEIVRYNYPLIVFGFSDLSDAFHPLFFM